MFIYQQASLYQPIHKLITRLCILVHAEIPGDYNLFVEGSVYTQKRERVAEVRIRLVIVELNKQPTLITVGNRNGRVQSTRYTFTLTTAQTRPVEDYHSFGSAQLSQALHCVARYTQIIAADKVSHYCVCLHRSRLRTCPP